MFVNHNEYEKLEYKIIDYSSYTSNYTPEHILEDDYTNPSSRWSTSSASLDQFILLKLERPSLIITSTFGKYCKVHVCNVKELLAYDGNNKEILRCSLKNDTEKETFNLTYRTDNTFLIIDTIKICPMSSWGMNFNYSIWFIELRGYSNVSHFLDFNYMMKHIYTKKMILKFFYNNFGEEREFKDKMCSLLGAEIEYDEIKDIRSLVLEDKFEELEKYMVELSTSGLHDEYLEMLPSNAKWIKIQKSDIWPKGRGGHQMVVRNGKLFLYGGWDGENEMGDTWEFDTKTLKWEKKTLEDDPGSRSCHKMVVFENKTYVFGRYIPGEFQKQTGWFDREVYVLDSKWEINKYYGGPINLFDHQMVVIHEDESCNENNITKTLQPIFYIFGGRTQNDHSYSGLLMMKRYEIRTIRSQNKMPSKTPGLKGRIGHNLIYIPKNYFKSTDGIFPSVNYNHSLLVIGGQRIKESFKEITFYKIETDTVYKNVLFPIQLDTKIVQRSILRNGEIIINFTFSREKDKLTESMLYIYNIRKDMWIKCNESDSKPSPRSAYQFISCEDMIYLFAGNVESNICKREDDLWRLEITKKSTEDIVKDIIFLIRKYIFLNLENNATSLNYLKQHVYEVVDHDNEEFKYKDLCCLKFKNVKFSKSELISEILKYLPSYMKAPDKSIEDLYI